MTQAIKPAAASSRLSLFTPAIMGIRPHNTPINRAPNQRSSLFQLAPTVLTNLCFDQDLLGAVRADFVIFGYLFVDEPDKYSTDRHCQDCTQNEATDDAG